MLSPKRRFFLVVQIESFMLLGSLILLVACGDVTPTPAPPTPTELPLPTSTAIASSPTPATSPVSIPSAQPGTSAVTITTPDSNQTPPPGAIKGIDGKYYWIVDPVLSFYKANSWLGLPLGGMREARPDGFNWDGLYQNFQRGRVEAHRGNDGKYSIELGLVNQELLKLKG